MTEKIQEKYLTVLVKKEHKTKQNFIYKAAGLKVQRWEEQTKKAKIEGVGWIIFGDKSNQERLGGANWENAVQSLPKIWIFI